MDARLNREFVHVHAGGEGNALSEEVVGELMELNELRDCTVSEHAGTITIACQGCEALGDLIVICTSGDEEGPDLRFFGALRAAIVKFIG